MRGFLFVQTRERKLRSFDDVSLVFCIFTSLAVTSLTGACTAFNFFATIVVAEGDGSKIYVSCIAFRDPVSEDIAEAYRLPTNSFADKCICLVSHSPSFRVLRDALEEIFSLCFSAAGSRYVLQNKLLEV